MKKYILAFFIGVLTSCTVIADHDKDGLSDGSRFLYKFYELRSTYNLYNILNWAGKLSDDNKWYLGNSPTQHALVGAWNKKQLQIDKDGMVYAQVTNAHGKPCFTEDKVFYLFQIISEGGSKGQFVILTTEHSPILEEDFFFLLLSKKTYSTKESALADMNSPDIRIPQLQVNVPMLELVYDVNDFVVEFKNKDEHLTQLKKNFTLLEFFGADTIENKMKKLQEVNYPILN